MEIVRLEKHLITDNLIHLYVRTVKNPNMDTDTDTEFMIIELINSIDCRKIVQLK